MDKVTLFAMTEKGYSVLASLLPRYSKMIDSVIAARDKNIVKDYFEEIAEMCRQHGVRFFNRTDTYKIRTKYVIAVSWRWLIKSDTTKVIVFHDSLLPRYRGFNPLVTALINGDAEIGITALYATEDYDRGDIIAQSKSSISYPLKIQEAMKIIIKNYQNVAFYIVDALANGKVLEANPQNETNASYSLWRDDEDYLVNWAAPATIIKRFVDAVGYPYKGAATMLDGRIVRLLDVESMDDVDISNRAPGKVIFVKNRKPVVVCGLGLLKINEIIDDQTGESLLPLSRFRVRFRS